MAGQGELAREVRAGLRVIEGNKNSKQVHVLDQLSYGKPIRRHVQEFAALFAAIFLGIAAAQIYKGRPDVYPLSMTAFAVVTLVLGYKFTSILHPVWKGWMKFAHILGLVMTTLLLSIAWTIVLIPVSILMRLVRIKVMNMEFDRSAKTYWEDRDSKFHNFKLLDRQF